MLSAITKRRMNACESAMVNEQIFRLYNTYAIELESPKDLPPFLEKMKNVTQGLYIKSDGDNLLKNGQSRDNVSVFRIPKEAKTLYDVCDWMYKEHTPSVDYALGAIACDDTRIVINVNHGVSDGDYCFNVVKDLMNPEKQHLFDNEAPIPGDPVTDILKERFDDYLKNKEKYAKKWPKYTTSDLTFLNIQDMPELPDRYNVIPPYLKIELKNSELSPHIYDKKTGKEHHTSEFLWTGLALAVSAKNQRYGPIGVETIMDLRRLAPNGKFDHSFGNAFTHFALAVKNPRPSMTVGELCQQFRNNFTILDNNQWFCKEYLTPLNYNVENCAVSHVSNVGPIKFHSPIKDFCLTVNSVEFGMRPFLMATSYSKIKEETGSNTFVLLMRYSPLVVNNRTAKDIFDTFVYFMKTADPSRKSGDVLDELIHFQKTLE